MAVMEGGDFMPPWSGTLALWAIFGVLVLIWLTGVHVLS